MSAGEVPPVPVPEDRPEEDPMAETLAGLDEVMLASARLLQVPVDPEVQAILDRWEQGSGELPWTAAPGKSGSDEGEDGGEGRSAA